MLADWNTALARDSTYKVALSLTVIGTQSSKKGIGILDGAELTVGLLGLITKISTSKLQVWAQVLGARFSGWSNDREPFALGTDDLSVGEADRQHS